MRPPDANDLNIPGWRRHAEHARTVTGLLVLVAAIVLLYGQIFHFLMANAGRHYSWVTGVYWTLVAIPRACR